MALATTPLTTVGLQDWMYTQASMEAIMQSATLSRLWHMQMTDALSRYGMRFGFGGVQPTDWLMSTEQQAVTNGRISDDYHSNLNDQGERHGLLTRVRTGPPPRRCLLSTTILFFLQAH